MKLVEFLSCKDEWTISFVVLNFCSEELTSGSKIEGFGVDSSSSVDVGVSFCWRVEFTTSTGVAKSLEEFLFGSLSIVELSWCIIDEFCSTVCLWANVVRNEFDCTEADTVINCSPEYFWETRFVGCNAVVNFCSTVKFARGRADGGISVRMELFWGIKIVSCTKEFAWDSADVGFRLKGLSWESNFTADFVWLTGDDGCSAELPWRINDESLIERFCWGAEVEICSVLPL